MSLKITWPAEFGTRIVLLACYFGGATADLGVKEVSATLGMLAVRLIVPANLAEVPVAKIIEIRKRYGADFDAFYERVATLAGQLADEVTETTDGKILKGYLDNQVRVAIQQPLRELEKSLRSVGVETTFAAANLKFQLPAAAASAAGFIGGNPVIGGAGAAAFAVASLARSARTQRAERMQPSAASYLLRVDRGLNPRSLIDRLRGGLS